MATVPSPQPRRPRGRPTILRPRPEAPSPLATYPPGPQARRPMRPAHRVTDEWLTPLAAAELLANTPFERQRPLNEAKVAEQLHLVGSGHLRPCTPITLARMGGRRYLLNGQHTLTALSRWRGPGYWLSVEEYTVHSADQIADLYKTFDRHRLRSLPDLYRADARHEAYGLSRRDLTKLGGAVPILARGFQDAPFSARAYGAILLKDFHVRDALIRAWAPAMVRFTSALEGSSKAVRDHLLRASVLAVALVTYRFAEAAAVRFWPAIAADSGLESGTPAHTLSRWLWEHTAQQHPPADAQRIVASAWNAHHATRPLKTPRQDRKAEQPILLAGTPHDGAEHYRYLGKDGQVFQTPRLVAGS